ncbi:pumilio-family RNA binding protein [Macrolepiota fuliginosa MF-IS2]|uniref:Pumilio-family RNA binding protein n=1 Tax=Macrolepiota fuliginosa MF-IS2 TaxID=1400762 RepID=A0A9P5XNU5_9AGAR|nr:pumilio-family RNA binding protein [Macrolepiota fuliginosa MF-IS2]
MNNSLENISPATDNHTASDDRKKSPPAFLDLADSAARLGSNMPDMSARVELKRLEHERQRLLQRKLFEDQMRALEEQQAQELLSIPFEAGGNGGVQHLAVSAPTTPPRVNAVLAGDMYGLGRNGRVQHSVDAESLSKAVGTVADKRKSVTYAPTVNLSPDLPTAPVGNGHGFPRSVGAKSMPASRRTSASSHDEELASHLQGLSLAGERSTRASPVPGPVSASILLRGNSRYNDDEGARYASTYNAGMMLDEQLDQEMHNAMRNLPTSDDDKYHNTFGNKVSKSSAALDLAHLSQQSREKPGEWPHFNSNPRGPDGIASRADRRTVTNPNLTLSTPSDDFSVKPLGGNVSASSTPLVVEPPQLSQIPLSLSRRGSPPGLLDSLSTTTRSVPTTPLGLPTTTAHLLKAGGTLTPDLQSLSVRIGTPGSQQLGDAGTGDIQASLSRLSSASFENGNLNFNTVQTSPDDYGLDSPYSMGGSVDGGRYSANSGSAGLYQHQNGTRYGLGLSGRTSAGPPDGKMNGLHGPKHKREVDREFNRFAGTRLEDLQGEIPTLCKDQHGCRYLQKKLEEGLPEHRDMIFRETFSHFTDLMTDPFGNYLCQKLLEFATDEQRNLICESVAQDLVNISLNMHGTRAVQKMIDFLSTRRQIHSIILALSLHVVALIKDLNGNHVIQKCLNKLAPEDNQFIYNAVAANCVEVATHRHGCCVLQRCVDHASDHQRIQLVNEITYNALTLVQDPYGNYVVQYILDLNDSRFSDAVIRQFQGNVCALSVQKFSSNVIEKCVRVAEHSTRKILIDELLNRSRLEKLLRDSYGNYCVQTALDYAEPAQRALLVEGIRPVLPLIRNTPYGKRIQNKLQREAQNLEFGTYQNHNHLVNMALSNQGMSPAHTPSRHLPQGLQGNHLSDIYSASNNVYGLPQTQATFTQAHLGTPIHGLQPQSIDGYVLQSSSSHNQGLAPSGFNGASFANRSAFGYGM